MAVGRTRFMAGSRRPRQGALKIADRRAVTLSCTPLIGKRSFQMDVSAIASAATAMSQQRVADAAGTLVLKKALNIQAESAAQLLQAIPTPPPVQPAGDHLIDTYA
jgi:hypothetical protein